MLSLFRKLSGRTERAAPREERTPVPHERVSSPGLPDFVVADHLVTENGFPYLRWRDVYAWMEALPDACRDAPWGEVTDAWNRHLCAALGAAYRIDKADGVVLISSLEPRLARMTLEFMQKTQRRIQRSLDALADSGGTGNELLVVFDDEDSYYRYIARFYPDGGEYAASSGTQLWDDGVVYYVTTKGHLRDVEPVIAHEMTHGALSHLALPTWLDEGIAVNMEHRLADNAPSLHSRAEMQSMHAKHWNPESVQEFWSGASYRVPGEPNMLSYDLGRMMVEHLAADWPRFVAFAREASRDDAGAESARRHLGISLGTMVAAMFEGQPAEAYEPRPTSWHAPALADARAPNTSR